MVKGCGPKMLKWCLIVFNFIFMIIGLAALTLGIYVQLDMDLREILVRVNELYEVKDLEKYLNAACIVLNVSGAIIVFLSILGCCGAAKEIKSMLFCYVVFLFLILAVEIAAVSITVVFKEQFNYKMKVILKKKLETSYLGYMGSRHGDDAFTTAMDILQLKGCYDKIMPQIIEQATILLAIGATLVTVQLTGMLSACCLMSDIKKTLKKKHRREKRRNRRANSDKPSV